MNVVAIVGSRDFPDLQRVYAYVLGLPDDAEVVTGDARGVDATVVRAAQKKCIPYTVFPANWRRHGRRAGPLRNAIIVERCNMVVAFWHNASPGTRSTIDLARRLGRPVTVIVP